MLHCVCLLHNNNVLHYNELENTVVLYPYEDETWDIQSNIALRLRKFPRAKPEGTPEGEGVYLTVYPESSPNTDSISFKHSLGL